MPLDLGDTIKRLRLASGFSQKELATRLEIDPSYLSHIEAGRREPSMQLVRRLADALSVPPGLLLAVVVWTEMPEEQRATYEGILQKLVELARVSQLKLPIE